VYYGAVFEAKKEIPAKERIPNEETSFRIAGIMATSHGKQGCGWQNAPSNVIHFNGERFLDLTWLRPHMPNRESLWTAYGL
jgi:hypothetical protein